MKYAALVFTLFFASHLTAAELTFGEAIGAPGHTVSVPVYLLNTQPISGISFSVEYDQVAFSFIEIEQAGTSMTPYTRENAPYLSLIFLDTESAQVLAAGKHELGRLIFAIKEDAQLGKYTLRGRDLDLADGKRPPERVQGIAESAELWITENWIRMGTGEWVSANEVKVDLNISTDRPLSAIQFALRWDARALAFENAHTSTSWQLFSHASEEQRVRIVAADFTGMQAFRGDNTPLISIHFRYSQEDSLQISLELNEVLMTDGAGEKVPVVWINGEIDTALRPEKPEVSLDGLHIEEILADPASSARGDANGDGTRHSREDEFIELINRGQETIDLSGYRLSDDDVAPDKMFGFPDGTVIAPGERLVLFGGGQPQGIPGQVFTDDGSIGNGLTNSGDVLVLIAPNGQDTLLVVPYESDAKDQSLVQKDGVWVGHSTIDGTLFSPGKAVGGLDSNNNKPPDKPKEEEDSDAPTNKDNNNSNEPVNDGKNSGDEPTDQKTSGDFRGLHIEEILADPASSARGDANGDGTRHSREDEFIELINRGQETIDLSGYRLSDDDVALAKMFGFPDGTVIAPGERLVLFGGGQPQGIPGQVFTDDGSIGNGLTNSGDVLVLIAPNGQDTLLVVPYESDAKDQSLVQKDGVWVGHSTIDGTLFSPGKAVGGLDSNKPPDEPKEEEDSDAPTDEHASDRGLHIAEILADPASSARGDANGDGTRHSREDEFIELINRGQETIDLSGYRLSDDDVAPDEMFSFPQGTAIAPGERLVLFGGGQPQGIPGQVFTDDGSIGNGLINSGDVLVLIAPSGEDTLLVVPYESDAKDQSLVQKDGVWVGHSTLYNALFSPGDTVDAAADEKKNNETETESFQKSEGLVISEVYPDPAAGADGDVNGDGVRHTYQDEFVELGNLSDNSVDIGGYFLGDDDTQTEGLFRFPDNTVLAPGDAVVLFGGGDRVAEGIFTDDGRIGDGLSNAGDTVLLLGTDGRTVVSSMHYDTSTKGISFARDDSGNYLLHNHIYEGVPISAGWLPQIVISEPDSMPDAKPDSAATENRPPNFLSATDTLALVGLAFQYMPRVRDPDGDRPNLSVPQPLDWLHWDGTHLSGLPAERDTGRVHVVIWATDGRDSVSHQMSVRVISLRAQLRKIGPVHASLTWRQQIDVPPSVQVQVDGGPQWHAQDRSLVWKPNGKGTYPVVVAISTDGGAEMFLPLSITVSGKPALRLHSVLVDPQRDVNGDGRVDALEDQYITVTNFGDIPTDISGWLLGDDDGDLTRLPTDTVLGPEDRLMLVGKIQEVSEEHVFSAGGRIGNGLAQSDRILLIAPAGPDTLIDVHYERGASGQPLVFEDGQAVDVSPPDNADPNEDRPEEAIPTDPKRVLYPSPNPFNSATVFGFYTAGGPVYVTVYNILGQPIRRLVQQHLPAGYYQRIWDGTNDAGAPVSSGVYLVYLKDRDATFTQRVALLR